MAAATFDMLIEQGIDYDYVLTVRSQAEGRPPLDLTGCTVRAHVRAHHGADALLLYDLATGGGLAITNPAAGKMALHIPAETSADWSWRVGVYDLELVSAGGQPLRLLRGAVRVVGEVTR
ncbi:hypothetical protein ABZ897_15880 [Nonomuraea sp. NPDC046802]|uniref:hypothetical protein n=1 Tax=Nonomuraea sp. NPDC046802 TaxID=3154919 RepID=UPI0033EA81C7